MSDIELAREIAHKFLDHWVGPYDADESCWIMCKGALAKLLMQIQYQARLDEAKWWEGSVDSMQVGGLSIRQRQRIARLQQAAGGSAAAKRGDAT